MSGITRGKALLAALGAAGLLLYAVVVDLGVNAGRIHYGVSVDGVAVGGMTKDKAERVLKRAARGLRTKELTFHRRGAVFHLEAKDVGWRPHPSRSAAAAMGVGRSGGIVSAAESRLEAWTGFKLPWSGKPKSARVARLVDEWSAKAARRGLAVDRGRLRFQLRRAIRRMPKDRYRIPLE
ncbi:hypothetical protein BH18ACT15_BH18ACT15_09770 [soil metagenome]